MPNRPYQHKTSERMKRNEDRSELLLHGHRPGGFGPRDLRRRCGRSPTAAMVSWPPSGVITTTAATTTVSWSITTFCDEKGSMYYAKVSARMTTEGADDAARFYSDLHVFGTPAECTEKIRWMQESTGCDTLLNSFSYFGMPFERVQSESPALRRRGPAGSQGDVTSGRGPGTRASSTGVGSAAQTRLGSPASTLLPRQGPGIGIRLTNHQAARWPARCFPASVAYARIPV